jgi:hypothetical protein
MAAPNYISNMLIAVAIIGMVVVCAIGMVSLMNEDTSISSFAGKGIEENISSQLYSINQTANRLNRLSSDMQAIDIDAGKSQDLSQESTFLDRIWSGAWKFIGQLKNYATFTTGSFATIFGIFNFLQLIPDVPKVVVTGLGVIVLITVIFGMLRYIGKIDL